MWTRVKAKWWNHRFFLIATWAQWSGQSMLWKQFLSLWYHHTTALVYFVLCNQITCTMCIIVKHWLWVENGGFHRCFGRQKAVIPMDPFKSLEWKKRLGRYWLYFMQFQSFILLLLNNTDYINFKVNFKELQWVCWPAGGALFPFVTMNRNDIVSPWVNTSVEEPTFYFWSILLF